MGVAIIVLAAKVKDADIFDSADDEIKRIGKLAFNLMIIFACFAVGISFLGFITAKFTKWYLVGCVRIRIYVILI